MSSRSRPITLRTTMVVLSEAVRVGTAPKNEKAATWAAWKVSVYSFG